MALSASAAQRLSWEAATLRKLTDSRIVRLIDGPFEVAGRTVIVLDRAGERTLADEIRQQGPLTIGELEKLGEDLLHAVLYLEEEKVWHRDIKPDNLALREVPRKGRRLVLFDFSLAGVPDSEIGVGTPVYLDPFLGTGSRQRYDQAAERYAVAVTLHEMASGELPSWGDGLVEASMLDPSEQLPHLAEDSFDPVLRDRLVEFFGRALHRDAARRFGSLKEMTRAWTDVFRGLDETPPLTTRHTITLDDSAEPDEARDAAAKAATADTPLAAAGLTARALSIAQQQLGVTTVGELLRVQPKRIMQLRGIGIIPRNELVRRAGQWRRPARPDRARRYHRQDIRCRTVLRSAVPHCVTTWRGRHVGGAGHRKPGRGRPAARPRSGTRRRRDAKPCGRSSACLMPRVIRRPSGPGRPSGTSSARPGAARKRSPACCPGCASAGPSRSRP